MLKITSPTKFESEKQYIIDTLIKEFLGLEYELKFDEDITDYILAFDNKRLIINDAFWNNVDDSYLKSEFIPDSTNSMSWPFEEYSENVEDLIILYGDEYFEQTDNEIIIGLDIFASAYFMLSRWEEYVCTNRDIHERFLAKDSLAHKNGFLCRPIVNEYTEYLWQLLNALGHEGTRKEHEYKIIPTHDIDYIQMWQSFYSVLKDSLVQLSKGHILQSFSSLILYLKIRYGNNSDPYDTHDYLMDLSDKYGLNSIFFLLVGGETKYDVGFNWDENALKDYCHDVFNRGHLIGYHASYNAYADKKLFKKELNYLKKCSNNNISWVRNHFLRFKTPESLAFINDAGFKYDSNVGYADHIGFRAGTCYSYLPFDFLNKKKLKLKEYPLLIMEGSLFTYQKLTKEESFNISKKVIDEVEKYNGNLVLLWHNTSLNKPKWKKYTGLYEKILDYAVSLRD